MGNGMGLNGVGNGMGSGGMNSGLNGLNGLNSNNSGISGLNSSTINSSIHSGVMNSGVNTGDTMNSGLNAEIMNSGSMNMGNAMNTAAMQGSYYANGYSAGSLAIDPSAVQNPSTLSEKKPLNGFNYSIGSILDGNGVPMNSYSLTSLSNVGKTGNDLNTGLNNNLAQSSQSQLQLNYSDQLTSMAANGIVSNGSGLNSGLTNTGYSQNNASQAIPPVSSYTNYYQNSGLTAQNSGLTAQTLTGSSYYPTSTSTPGQQANSNQYSTNNYYPYSSNAQIIDSTGNTISQNYYPATNTQVGVLDETYYNPQYMPVADHTGSQTTIPLSSSVPKPVDSTGSKRKRKPGPSKQTVKRQKEGAAQHYFCPHTPCDKSYSTKGNLEQHVRANHLNTNYECPLCPGKSFKWASGLSIHKKKCHPGEKI